MKPAEQIPYYAPDETSLGFRSMEAAKRLIAGFVKPSYGRKGHLKAIWLRQEDGSSPVETHARAGTRYGFLENLEHGTGVAGNCGGWIGVMRMESHSPHAASSCKS